MIETYPVFYWRVTPDLFIGELIGHRGPASVASSLSKLQKTITDQITRLKKTTGITPHLERCELSFFEVKCRPTYRSAALSIPTEDPLTLRVAILSDHSQERDDERGRRCVIPLTGDVFYFSSAQQRNELIRYVVHNYTARLSPEELYRVSMRPPPTLLTIRYKVSERRRRNIDQWGLLQLINQQTTALSEVADRLPRSGVTPHKHGVWERHAEVDRCCELIIRERAHVLVVGEPGVGKSAVIHEVVRRVIAADHETPIWETSPHKVIAGARYLGDWEERCESIMSELASEGGYLYMKQITHLTRAGGDEVERSVAAFMYPALQRKMWGMIGEVTPRELETLRLTLPRFANLFEVVHVEEMTHAQTHKALTLYRESLMRQYELNIESEVLSLTYQLLSRFERQARFPGKAVKFISECVNRALTNQREPVTTDLVLSEFLKRSGLPELILRDDQLVTDELLTDYFERRIIGQPDALREVYQIIKLFKVGLNDPKKPISTLFFAGPTGVGKTACAQAISEFFFGQGQRKRPLIHIDMSELQHPMHIDRLIGSSGHSAGRLVEQVRESPFSVILLDEIEKAHPAVFDVLLSVFDEGVLYDVFGRATYFYNTIIIMTSNLGARQRKSAGFAISSADPFLEAVKGFFRPEFFNRIDRVIPFHSLDEDSIEEIARKELRGLAEREGIKRRALTLEYTDVLVQAIAQEGFSPEYGARPLQRAIDRHVVAPFSYYLALHAELEGCALTLDWREGELAIEGPHARD